MENITLEEFIEIKPNLEEIVKRLEKVIICPKKNIEGQRKDVANALGMKASALSQAIKQNSIPYSRLYTFSRTNYISLDWILDGIDLDKMVKKHNLSQFEILITLHKGAILQLLSLDKKKRAKQMEIITNEIYNKNRMMSKEVFLSDSLGSLDISIVDLTISKLKEMDMDIEITKHPETKSFGRFKYMNLYRCIIDDKAYRLLHCENFNVATNYLGLLASGSDEEKNFQYLSDEVFLGTDEEVVVIMAERFYSKTLFPY